MANEDAIVSYLDSISKEMHILNENIVSLTNTIIGFGEDGEDYLSVKTYNNAKEK